MAREKQTMASLIAGARTVPTSDDVSTLPTRSIAPTVDRNSVRGKERKTVPIEKVIPNPYNKFTMIEDEEYLELVELIKKDGLTNPIVVKPEDEDGNYMILSGHRRRMACEQLGLDKVPIQIDRTADDLSASEQIALIGRHNGGTRQKYPFSYALQLREYYEALEKEGNEVDIANKKKKASEAFAIPLRTVYNYDSLTTLPDEILEFGNKGLLNSQAGYILVKALGNSSTENIANTTIEKIKGIATSDIEDKDKISNIKAVTDELEAVLDTRKKINKEKSDTSTGKKNEPVKVYKMLQKTSTLLSVEEERLVFPNSEKQKATLEKSLQEIKDKIKRIEELYFK